ncbi:MAG: hypothetical protein DMD45_01715, partial [Gemmatimonadetes bacterium]
MFRHADVVRLGRGAGRFRPGVRAVRARRPAVSSQLLSEPGAGRGDPQPRPGACYGGDLQARPRSRAALVLRARRRAGLRVLLPFRRAGEGVVLGRRAGLAAGLPLRDRRAGRAVLAGRPPVRRATFWFIFGTVLLDMLALGIIAPVFPKLVIQLEGGNDASAAGALGLFGTVWAAMQFVFAPVLGALSDRVGRRPVILLSCLGLGLDYGIMALAPTVGWLFVGRVLSGITASSFSTSFAYIADVTEPD